MARVILIPGIETDGHSNVFKLAPALEAAGFDVIIFNYPHWRFWDTFSREKSDRNAELLLAIVRPGDHVIGHSNAARVIHRAMQMGARFAQVYLFAPAFGARTVWPEDGAQKINIIHNFFDRALRLGSLIPGHAFGWLGAIGYQGPFDGRIHSISDRSKNTVDKNEHSYMFQNPKRLAFWESYLIKRLSA